MKKSVKIKNLLSERYEASSGKQKISESVKIFKTSEKDGKYKIFITSDLKDQTARDKETAKMGFKLNVSAKNLGNFKNTFSFQPPSYLKNLTSNGAFGWGYEITNLDSPDKVNTLVGQLKELVHHYNTVEKQDYDLSTHNLTPEQITQINAIVDAVEGTKEAAESTGNVQVAQNLDRYLDDLMNAVENDDVFEFLIDTFEKVKQFQSQNDNFHSYSFLNSLIIRFSDPNATFAAPKFVWADKGYSIKPEFSKGILILKPGNKKNTTKDNAYWYKNNPNAWNQYKSEKNLNRDLSIDQYLSDTKNHYGLATFGLKNNFFGTTSGAQNRFPTFTDKMIEPIPGVEQVPLETKEFSAKDDAIQSDEVINKISNVFDVVSKIAEKEKVNTLGIGEERGDINNLNVLLNKVISKTFGNKYDYIFKDIKNAREREDSVKGFAEVISNIVKRHYGLPSESSKYNVASLGIDKEKIGSYSKTLLNFSNEFIKLIDSSKNGSDNISENYIRKIVRKVISEHKF